MKLLKIISNNIIKNYFIEISKELPLDQSHNLVINSISSKDINSGYQRMVSQYGAKTRAVSLEEYYENKHDLIAKQCYKSPFVQELAKKEMNNQLYTISANLEEYEAIALSTKEGITAVRENIPKKTLGLSANTAQTLQSYSPNNNFGLVADNSSFFNFTENATSYFNLDNASSAQSYAYTEAVDQSIDIIVIDDGVYALHENFIRQDGTNICQFTVAQQKNKPWRLSSLLTAANINYRFDANVPEGVATTDPNYVSYYGPVNADLNHGTFCAGIICGTYNGWLKGKNVRLHSIPLVTSTFFILGLEIFMELAIIDFQMNKIATGDYSPTLINRSYGVDVPFNNMDQFSNLDSTYNRGTDIRINTTSNRLLLFNYTFPIFYAVQRNLGVINCFAAGNATELQLPYSTNPQNYYNRFYLDSFNYAFYPYRPIYSVLKSEYFTINKLRLEEINYEFALKPEHATLTTGGVQLNTALLNSLVAQGQINYNSTYQILEALPPTYNIGSVGLSTFYLPNTLDQLKINNYSKFAYYNQSGFSSFGNAVYFAQGASVVSSEALIANNLVSNLYNISNGTSYSTPNFLGILAVYLSYVFKNGWISPTTNNVTKSIDYDNDYLSQFNIEFKKNLNTISDLENYFTELYYFNYSLKPVTNYTDIYPYFNPQNPNYVIEETGLNYNVVFKTDMTKITDPFPLTTKFLIYVSDLNQLKALNTQITTILNKYNP